MQLAVAADSQAEATLGPPRRIQAIVVATALAEAALRAQQDDALRPVLDCPIDTGVEREQRIAILGRVAGRRDLPDAVRRWHEQRELIEHRDLRIAKPPLAAWLAIVEYEIAEAALRLGKRHRDDS